MMKPEDDRDEFRAAPTSPDRPSLSVAQVAPPRLARGTIRPGARPPIAPDGDDHRAVIVSSAMLREWAREWWRRGMACTGARFNGETGLDAPAVQSIMDVEFARQYRDRNK